MGIAATAVVLMLVFTSCTGEPERDDDIGEDPLVVERLDALWDRVNSDGSLGERPVVERERYVSPQEWAPVVAACMVEEGFPGVTATADGGICSGDLPSAQAGAYSLAEYVCNARYPVDPKYLAPLESSQLDTLYEYMTGELTACLVSFGFSVADPPSLVRFRETWGTAEAWTPYSPSVTPNIADDYGLFLEVSAACPQYPDNLYD